ncbi:uncharacterized protein LOC141857512 [Brevipalpus obovatus]|uniref:uncharacterized protein LOC141857512 n=1 Tax=Brevipalpus obovatus TaxID=246614 RepID=UPI003D9E6374
MMKPEVFEEFNFWYREQVDSDQVFNFKEDIIKYCSNNVEILASCCLAFRSKFLTLNGLDPFTRCFTIAQVSLELLRALYLEPETLANTPKNGYTNLRKCSRESLAWLDFQSRALNTKVIREFKIGSKYADGFSAELNTVFEYFGCYWHGCRQCFPVNRDSQQAFHGDTLNTRLSKTPDKLAYYRSHGYNIISIWGCEARAQLSHDIEFKQYFNERKKYWNKIDLHGHIVVKESFFGGRTNNIRFHHKCTSSQKIKYMDVNSLYPLVLKTKEYLIGHPIVINENFDPTIKTYFGFVKCRILPPTDLYLPILPARIAKKLIFTLCRACAELEMTKCIHNEHNRSLLGTWTTPELQFALAHGYRVLDFIEVLHYPRSSSSIFKGYIDKILKLKHEASEVKIREGIELNPENMIKNPAMRFISKLLLNSLWDSVIYFRDRTDRQVECGDHLGQFKDEIIAEYGQNAFIEEFVTCGPKNYAYRIRLLSGEVKTTIKTKGITLNRASLKTIDYEFMLDAAKKYAAGETQERSAKVPQFNILTDSHHNVLTKYFSKAYRVVSKKRIVKHNRTFPYGSMGDRTKYLNET